MYNTYISDEEHGSNNYFYLNIAIQAVVHESPTTTSTEEAECFRFTRKS